MWALVRNLPPEAAVWREHAWPHDVEMAATLVERVDMWGDTFLRFMSGKRVQPPAPLRYRRPGDPEPERPSGPIAGRVRDFMARHFGG